MDSLVSLLDRRQRSMFLVFDDNKRVYVFTRQDPRLDGFSGDVQEDVRLMESDGARAVAVIGTQLVPCLGVAEHDDALYMVFKSTKDCRHAGFRPLGSKYFVVERWADF